MIAAWESIETERVKGSDCRGKTREARQSLLTGEKSAGMSMSIGAKE